VTRTLLTVLVLAPLVSGCSRPTPARNGAEAEPPVSEPPELVVNPAYQRWSGFKTGTTVTYRAVTGADGEKGVTTTTTTYKLIELTDELAVVEMVAATKRYDGVETTNPPERLTNSRLVHLPPGVSKDDFGKPPGAADQDEVVAVGGRTYKTRRHEGRASNEAGQVHITTWTSDEVPGGLVKSTMLTPAIGKKTTTELLSVTVP